MFIHSVSYFLIIVVSLVEVHSQLCKTRTIVTTRVLITYTQLYVDARTRISSKWVTKSEPKEIQKCCDGYQQHNIYGLSVCKPICKPNCTNGYCVLPNTCLCLSGYNLVNGTCQPRCRHPCGNGTCVSDFCYCFPGFQINYLRLLGHEDGPVCEPICKDCAKKQKLSRSSEHTTTTSNNPLITMSANNTYEYHTEDTTTTTKDPHITMTTYNNYKNHTEDTTTTTKDPHITMTTYNNYKYRTEDTTTSTTTTPNFVINRIVNKSNSRSAETVLDNDANNNITSTDMMQKSWMQQHGMYIWIPLLLILSTALILLLVWQGAPMVIINFYKGVRNRRSYNVQGAFRKQSASCPFDSSCLEFLPDERGSQN